jgi:hypothetical protein
MLLVSSAAREKRKLSQAANSFLGEEIDTAD